MNARERDDGPERRDEGSSAARTGGEQMLLKRSANLFASSVMTGTRPQVASTEAKSDPSAPATMPPESWWNRIRRRLTGRVR